MEIKCIVFDWGGVLIDNPVEDFANEYANRIGVDVEQLKSAYSEYAYQFERGLIEESNLWEKIGKKLNVRIKSENSIWYECFQNIYSPRSEIFNLAIGLRQNGYLIALLSNTEIPAMNFFNAQNYDMFDYKVFSCKEGEAKPEPQLYKILLDKLGIPAEQILFIDDKLENIETAKKLNMRAVQYLSKDDLFKNLREHSINI